jgi:hypothetical protein
MKNNKKKKKMVSFISIPTRIAHHHPNRPTTSPSPSSQPPPVQTERLKNLFIDSFF